MATHDWKPVLEAFSSTMLQSGKLNSLLPQEVLDSGWLGYPGATEEQIVAAEKRLGVSLPPSYRDFLKVSNGWRHVGAFIYKLWPVESIEWLRVRNRGFIDIVSMYEEKDAPPLPDEERFDYDDQQDWYPRADQLEAVLEISDWGDSAILLLNPKVVTSTGEWEAWFFADWLPGATRYRSFWDLMQAEYQKFLDLSDRRLRPVPLEPLRMFARRLLNRVHVPLYKFLSKIVGYIVLQIFLRVFKKDMQEVFGVEFKPALLRMDVVTDLDSLVASLKQQVMLYEATAKRPPGSAKIQKMEAAGYTGLAGAIREGIEELEQLQDRSLDEQTKLAELRSLAAALGEDVEKLRLEYAGHVQNGWPPEAKDVEDTEYQAGYAGGKAIVYEGLQKMLGE